MSYKPPEAYFRVRANSRPAVALVVLKEGDANTLEVARSIRRELRDMQESPSLQRILMVPLFDQGRVITECLDTLLDSGKIGGIFAVVVLYFFLRRLRMTLIITLAIPLSLLIALTVMFFADESLNILSLLALMISVGLLVDNSVVVAENIHRLHRSGVPRREAAIRGTAEIALAIIMATLTTIVVFLPVSLVGGQAQFFLLRLSIPISVALLASLVVAGVFVPLSVYLTLAESDKPGGREWFFRPAYRRFVALMERIYDATFGRLNHLYGRLLGVFLRRRLDLVIGVLVVFAVTAAVPMQEVKFVEIQEEERGGFEIEVRLPRSTTLEEAEAFFLECEAIVEDSAEELGLSGWFIFHRETFGEIQGFFDNPRTTDLTPREVTEIVLERLPERPGVNYYTGQESESEEKGEQVHVITLYGDDAEQLETTAEDLEALFTSIPGVLGVKATGDPAPSELGARHRPRAGAAAEHQPQGGGRDGGLRPARSAAQPLSHRRQRHPGADPLHRGGSGDPQPAQELLPADGRGWLRAAVVGHRHLLPQDGAPNLPARQADLAHHHPRARAGAARTRPGDAWPRSRRPSSCPKGFASVSRRGRTVRPRISAA